MNREDWLAERKKGICSSDAAALLGISPWNTAFSIYADKLGMLPEQPMTEAMKWGLRHEPAIAAAYEEETGAELTGPRGSLHRHKDQRWMLATPDRITTAGRIVELKTASAFAASEWGEPGTDEIPDAYLVQVNHQLEVLGADVADVAVLIGGSDFRVYTVPRNGRLIAHLVEVERVFWHEHVLARIPPEPSWTHPATAKALEALYPPEEHIESWLPEEALRWADDYERLGFAAGDLGELRAIAKGHLLHALGPASIGHLPDGRTIRRKNVSRKGYTCAPSEYMSFRIQAAKEHIHDQD
jgi:putative phage-type endonuclease